MAEKDNFQNNELLAYIGMEINALLTQGYSSSQTKHLVSAQLVECIMKTVAVKEKDEFAADGKMAIRTKNKWKWKAVRRE